MIKLTTCYLWLLLISLLYCVVILFFLLRCYSFLTGHSEERCPWCWLKYVFHLEKVAVVLCTLYTMERFYSETCTFKEFWKEMPLSAIDKFLERHKIDGSWPPFSHQNSGEDFYLQFLKMLGHRLDYLWLLRKGWH